MRAMMVALLSALFVSSCGTVAPPHGHSAPATRPSAEVPGHYAPFAFLVGEWDVAAASGGPAAAVARFRWGPGRSYLWYSVSTLAGGREDPHFEGMLVWNGRSGKLDMLLSLDLARGLVQEQGSMRVDANGTVVREITAIYSEGAPLPPRGERRAGPGGAAETFRQTFRALPDGRVATSLLRRAGDGWVPTFPTSEAMVMTRRTG